MRHFRATVRLLWVIGTELFRHALTAPRRWLAGKDRRKTLVWRAWGGTLRRVCERAGPTFIKLGQILSSRPDLFPTEIIEELSHLQDNVAGADPAAMVRVLEQDLHCDLKEHYPEFILRPIAAASVAQVHRATLRDGAAVAVKIQRPGIGRRFEDDLSTLSLFSYLLDFLPGAKNLDFPTQVNEFATAVHSQLDFAQERRNNRLFAELFKNIDWVRLPRMYEGLSGDHVITMEFVEGEKIPQFMRRSGRRPRPDLADRMYRLYVTMSLQLRTMHADLHPGNLLIDERERFVLLDTGLVYTIPREYVERYYRIFLAISTFDGELLARTYLHGQAGYTPAQMEVINRATSEITNLMASTREGELDFSVIWAKFMALMRDNGVRFDRQMTMLFVADSTFAGMARQLDPKFDYIGFMMKEGPRIILEQNVLDMNDPLNRELVARFLEAQRSRGVTVTAAPSLLR